MTESMPASISKSLSDSPSKADLSKVTPSSLPYDYYVLKISGDHGLVFKARHGSEEYLRQMAECLIELPNSNFNDFKIYSCLDANLEMTKADNELHIDVQELCSR